VPDIVLQDKMTGKIASSKKRITKKKKQTGPKKNFNLNNLDQESKKEAFHHFENRVKAKLPPVSRKNNILLKKERQKINPDLYPKPGADSETKKRLRMIRNRESAALSRKRKQDRVVQLEDEVLRLREEVVDLQQKLAAATVGTDRKDEQLKYNYNDDILTDTEFDDHDLDFNIFIPNTDITNTDETFSQSQPYYAFNTHKQASLYNKDLKI